MVELFGLVNGVAGEVGAQLLEGGGATIFGCFSGVGFALALLLFASLRERLELATPPKAFQGTPIALITAGILAMAFVGFAGLC